MLGQETYELCLRLYKDVINGYSTATLDGRNLYIRHLRDIDYALIEQKRLAYRQEGASRGLFSARENLEMLVKTGHWTWPEEEEYQTRCSEIKNLRETESQIFLESQKKVIADRVKKKEGELSEMAKFRNLLPLSTTESYANEKLNTFIIQFSFYESNDLRGNLFSEEDFNALHMEDVESLHSLYYVVLEKFKELNLKRISCLGVFINSFMLAKGNPYYFFGKAVTDLTTYQTIICGHGNSYKNILENSDNSIPAYEDIDDSVAWYERERELIKKKYSNNSTPPSTGGKSPKSERIEAFSTPQASEQEIEAIGFQKDAQPMNLVEAAEKLKKKLGKDSLDIHDMVKLHA